MRVVEPDLVVHLVRQHPQVMGSGELEQLHQRLPSGGCGRVTRGVQQQHFGAVGDVGLDPGGVRDEVVLRRQREQMLLCLSSRVRGVFEELVDVAGDVEVDPLEWTLR